MQLRRHCLYRFLLSIFLCLSAAVAYCQPTSYPVLSIEVPVLNASSIVTGTVDGYAGDDEPGHVRQVVVKVDETLKGPLKPQVVLATEATTTDLRIWKARKTRLLVILWPSIYSFRPIIDLDDDNLLQYREDFTAIRDSNGLLRYIRETVRKNPGVSQIQYVNATAPKNTAGTTWLRDHKGPPQGLLCVPLDAKVERDALALVGSNDFGEAVSGIRILRFFHSQRNETIIRGLLSSNLLGPEWELQNYGLYKKKHFGVREEALRVLEEWNVPVSKPAIEELVPQFDTVEEADWYSNMPESWFSKLALCKNLRSLSINENRLTEADLAEIARATTVEKLLFESCPSLGDWAVPYFAKMPNLHELGLNASALTDDGLRMLAGLKGLRTLSVYQTKVTNAGLAEFLRLRPDVRLSPEQLKV